MPAVNPIPDGYHTITPYLTVNGAAQAIDYYVAVFGATELFRLPMPDGRVGHAELQIGDARMMLADESPEWGNIAATTLGGSPAGLMYYCPDVDVVFQRAVDAGATVKMAVADQFYGDRSGTVVDPFGHIWTIATHIEDVSPEEMDRRMAQMASAQPG